MGRSRAVHHADEDPNQRSKRKRTAYNAENMENASTGEGVSEGKGSLYHCNYCNKDISGVIRIKCAICLDFDLCIECFSVGAEVTPHKSNHPYRVMDNLSFPLICPEWNVDEEILLLEGIGTHGFGNWNEVAEYVGSKSKTECIHHYNDVYMNSPYFPLPDLSHVMGKSREELLAMAKGHCKIKTEFPSLTELTPKEEATFAGTVICEEPRKDDPGGHSSSSLTAEIGSLVGLSSINTPSAAPKKNSNVAQFKDGIKVEEFQSDRSIGEKKPRLSGEQGPAMTELSGYNFKRQEFETEFDNDAEQLLADMEFKETDSESDHQRKLQVLHIYSKRLDERKRRKDFILERNLLYPDPFEKNLSPEEREIYQRLKVFMRYHSKEEHEEFMKSVIEEHMIVKRIQELQEARAAGCRTAAEANRFLEQKMKKEAEENAQRVKESTQGGPSGKVVVRLNHVKSEVDGIPRGVVRGASGLQPSANDSSSTTGRQTTLGSLDIWDITGLPGADLLSENEKKLCGEIRILPSHYLRMLEVLSAEKLKGRVTKKSDAHGLFKVEPSKVDRVYDMMVEKGITQA